MVGVGGLAGDCLYWWSLGADRLGIRASGAKRAAGRGVKRGGDLSFEDHPGFLLFGEVFGNGGNERLSIWVAGVGKKIGNGGLLHDLAHIEYDYTIAKIFDEREVMGDKKIAKR